MELLMEKGHAEMENINDFILTKQIDVLWRTYLDMESLDGRITSI